MKYYSKYNLLKLTTNMWGLGWFSYHVRIHKFGMNAVDFKTIAVLNIFIENRSDFCHEM